MFVVAKKKYATAVAVVLGSLALGGCFGESMSLTVGTESSDLAMIVGNCADQYLTCREECSGDKESQHPRVGGGGTWEPLYPGAGGGAGSLPGGQMDCFYPIGTQTKTPAATAEYVLETYSGKKTVRIRLTFNPDFVDNTYGAGSIGWGSKGHKFKELVGSDHAELELFNKLGVKKAHFKVDYISEKPNTASGYGTLGVSGKDGKMIEGDASIVVGAMTSLDRNLNERGYSQMVVDSPATNEAYKPNPSAPDWDYRLVYEVWVKASAFGVAGFGSAKMSFVHASPSKTGEHTVNVRQDECPSDWFVPDTDTGSDQDTDTGTPTDQDTDTGTASNQDTDTGTPTDQETDTGTSGDKDTDSHDDTPSDGDDDDGRCFEQCETILDQCTEDSRCNDTKTDDSCVDDFDSCADRCEGKFRICAKYGTVEECQPELDACVKTCVTNVDNCAKDVVRLPRDEDDEVCDPNQDISVI